jgi:dipeptidyl aminopeptidase/acylaminoacyl peptidase
MRWDAPVPNEREVEERTWEVVRRAWEERVPLARPNLVRRRWPVFALAAGLVVVAAALSPPGMAVLGSIRDAVQKTDNLTSLPTSGRILVNTPAGAWVVQQDGSKRLLSGYSDAAWSPHGLYLSAARGNTLVALEPNGSVHWKVARTHPVGAPQWSFEGYRIAYLDGHALRIVNGNGTGDHVLAPNAVGAGLPALAWRPGTHELAYKNARNELLLVDVDRSRILWRRPTKGVERVLWSDDGKRLLVATQPALVLDARGRTIARVPTGTPAAFVPHSESLALAVPRGGRSSVLLLSGPHYRHRRVVFSGAGVFAALAWSPDRRWLLVDWTTADQWVFVRVSPTPRVRTISDISSTFGTGPESRFSVAGWCCS